MPADVLEAIFTDFSTLIQSLNLTIPGSPISTDGISTEPAILPIVVRKGPKRQPKIDPPSHITISKAQEPEKKIKIAFGHMATVWTIEITMIAPNYGDWVRNLTTYTLYRQRIAALFGPPYSDPLLPTTPGVYNLVIVPDEFLNRDEMAQANIDRWTLKIAVYTAE